MWLFRNSKLNWCASCSYNLRWNQTKFLVSIFRTFSCSPYTFYKNLSGNNRNIVNCVIQNITDAPIISVRTTYIRELKACRFKKKFGREFLQGEPCSRLDISVHMLRCVSRRHILLHCEFKWCVALVWHRNASGITHQL